MAEINYINGYEIADAKARENTGRINEVNSELQIEKATRQAADTNLQNQVNSLASGSPLVASSTSDMTDTTRVYVNTTDNKWYYYDGEDWQSGGDYQAAIISEGSVTPIKTSFLKRAVNLWDGTYIHGCVVAGSSSSGYYVGKRELNGVIAIIKIEGGKKYTISKSGGVNLFRMALYENYPTFVEGSNPTPEQKALRGSTFDNNTTYTVNANQNANYLVVGLAGASYDTEPDDFQVEEGNTATDFNYDYNIQNVKITNENIDDNSINKSKISNDNDLGYKSYDLTNLYLSDASTYFTPPETRSINDIYSLYDDLMETYPDYITKDIIGNDSDDNPIYIYKFRRDKENKSTIPNKIITISQLHSFEIRNIYATYLFIKDMLENWQTKPILKSLRFNFDYDVLPLVNPWGYLNDTRYNKNDVELNRNFPAKWDETPAEGYHKGTAPLSEVETQALYNYINANKDKICWFIDTHVSSNNDHWVGSYLASDLACLNGISNLMACVLNENWPESQTKTINVKTPATGSLTCYNNSLNIHGNILECGYMTGYGNVTATQFFTTFVGNTLISISKSFD